MSSGIKRTEAQEKNRQQVEALKEHVAYLRTQLMNAGQDRAMLSPPTVVSGLIVHRTVGDDLKFGRCTHALQLLPNNAVLLLVTPEGNVPSASTFFLGEECHGFTAEKTMIETPDAPGQS